MSARLHAVGREEFTLSSNADGTRTLTTTFDYTDRTTRRPTSANADDHSGRAL
jgi:hypothetical protein